MTSITAIGQMTNLQLAKRVAQIVVYGHILLFLYGLVVLLVGPLGFNNIAQMILMGSPLLALVGISAARFMSSLRGVPDISGPADPDWARMAQLTTLAFLVALFATYSCGAFQSSFSPDVLKFVVGAIETVLGGYLGVNRDALFPDPPKQTE
jgi:hypothetical protein